MNEFVLVHARIVFDANIGTSYASDPSEVCDIYNHNNFLAGVTRTAEGTFKIYFTDKWVGFGGMIVTRVKDADCAVILLAEDVDNATAGSGYVQVAFQTAGTDADPDGETVEFNFWLHNSIDGWDAS